MNKPQLKGWLQSSMNPEQVSTTIRGIGATLSGVILLTLALVSHPVSPDALTATVDQVAILGGQLATGLGAAVAIYGLIMKAVMFLGIKSQ